MIGLYTITHIPTRRAYVGSSVDICKRFVTHRSMLKNNYHHSSYLQNAWNKYGKQEFEFKQIATCKDHQEAMELEQAFLECYCNDGLFNIKNEAFGVGSGKSHPNKGKPLTEEHKQKISSTMKGMEQKPHTEQTVQKISKNRARYIVTTPDGQFYGFASAGKHYGISEVAAKKRCKILKFNWSYERI